MAISNPLIGLCEHFSARTAHLLSVPILPTPNSLPYADAVMFPIVGGFSRSSSFALGVRNFTASPFFFLRFGATTHTQLANGAAPWSGFLASQHLKRRFFLFSAFTGFFFALVGVPSHFPLEFHRDPIRFGAFLEVFSKRLFLVYVPCGLFFLMVHGCRWTGVSALLFSLSPLLHWIVFLYFSRPADCV